MRFETLISPKKEDHDAVVNALIAHNSTIVGPNGRTDITVHLKDEDGVLIGGSNGFTHWNYFFIAHLWLKDSVRGGGTGAKLLRHMEEQALLRGCTHCWLDTFSFQAPGFYEKYGYKRFGELPDYPPGHQRYFYFKRFA